MIYCINRVKKETVAGQRTAGKKAPDDVARIIAENFESIVFPFYESEHKNSALSIVYKFLVNKKNWRDLFKSIKKGDVLIVQHPYEGIKQSAKMLRKCSKLKVKTILFIHDLATLRNSIDVSEPSYMEYLTRKQEISALVTADFIVCHNKHMKSYLASVGVDDEKIYCLDVFDYLFNGDSNNTRVLSKDICVAGNLAANKSGYIYQLIENNERFKIHLYGPNYTGPHNRLVNYEGLFSPEELPSKLEGSFGLVWDGNSITECAGIAGNYLRINNPHKCSLYIVANIPIIIWASAAMAEFVKKNKIGLCVNSIDEIETTIGNISDTEYEEMVLNTIKIKKQLKVGYNTSKVINMILEEIQTRNLGIERQNL